MGKNASIVLLGLSLGLLGSSCAPEPSEVSRNFVDQKTPLGIGGVPTLASRFETAEVAEACELVDELEKDAPAGDGTFQMLSSIRYSNSKKTLVGRVDPLYFPLLQFKVGTDMPDGNEKAFWASVLAKKKICDDADDLKKKCKKLSGDEKARCEKKQKKLSGRCEFKGIGGAAKWAALRGAKKLGQLDLLMPGAINDSLEAGFPGVYGESEPMDKSLHALLMKKTLGWHTLPLSLPFEILRKRLPLFSGSGGWEDWAKGMERELPSALKSMRPEEVITPDVQARRFCGLTLWHRSFGQLLAMMGHLSPKVFEFDSKHRIRKLSLKHKRYDRFLRLGGFVDPSTGDRVALSGDDLAGYDPEAQPYWPVAESPAKHKTRGYNADLDLGRATLRDYLYLARGWVDVFAATHPGAPWFQSGESAYPLGDFTNPDDPSILPSSMHSLVLGYVTMAFKNLAAFSIVKVDANGVEAKTDADVAGVLLLDDYDRGSGKGVVRLADLGVFSEVVVRLKQALSYFDQDLDWQKLHPSYTPETVARLKGLRDTLSSLRFPIAQLMLKMGRAEGGCVSSLDWDTARGDVLPGSACSGGEVEQYRSGLRYLAMDLQSKALFRRASE